MNLLWKKWVQAVEKKWALFTHDLIPCFSNAHPQSYPPIINYDKPVFTVLFLEIHRNLFPLLLLRDL